LSGKIWLIVEDKTDEYVVREILKKRGVIVKLKVSHPPHGGISRLAAVVENLIKTARKDRQFSSKRDCIAVLHDWDEYRQQSNRKHYKDIERICTKYKVKLIIARDEIESWILADSSICQWLGLQPRNWDAVRKPKAELNRLLQKKYRMKYQASDRAEVLKKLAGDADKHSPSMREALQHLDNAPCVRP
jgi:hypothetical protein